MLNNIHYKWEALNSFSGKKETNVGGKKEKKKIRGPTLALPAFQYSIPTH